MRSSLHEILLLCTRSPSTMLNVSFLAGLRPVCVHFAPSGFMAFSHGANDIANAAGPFVAVWDTYTRGEVAHEVGTYFWIVLLSCVGVVLGLGLWVPK